MISVLLVDDHVMVRKGFRHLLEASPLFCIAGEAATGEEGFRLYAELHPDVVVLDLMMPGEGGLATLRRLISRDAGARVLVLSMFDEPGIIRRALDAGALGYLSKGAPIDALSQAVSTVAAGHLYMENSLLHQSGSAAGSPLELLTTREFEVFAMLAMGRSVIDIAALLHLSEKTVGAHRTSIMKKLALKNSAELVHKAMAWDLLQSPFISDTGD
ncbi:response regulator transcription factor [Mariprofundus erugo]|uniref:Response regulator transcription factor n=1 Tax=Mariprofundus erugo TaxID=2528639 RepID=A0A5R9GMH1_9PROT|nr:response regulator transcription factor [Mariprofundus erugo]TLS65487.1 response regulator transcription factor [Mariprofundus erugo]TLS75679.1 response regulator transcription factor [Mariprofundus erugo]